MCIFKNVLALHFFSQTFSSKHLNHINVFEVQSKVKAKSWRESDARFENQCS